MTDVDDFDYVTEFDPGRAMAWVDMPELGEEAQILVRPATQSNKPYYNAMLRTSGKRARQLAKRGTISVADLEKNRLEDRDLFPKFVIADWRHVEKGSDRGKPKEDKEYVAFNRDAAKALCKKLPAHLFDRLRDHAATEENFYPDDKLPPDPEELAGNSENVSSGS